MSRAGYSQAFKKYAPSALNSLDTIKVPQFAEAITASEEQGALAYGNCQVANESGSNFTQFSCSSQLAEAGNGEPIALDGDGNPIAATLPTDFDLLGLGVEEQGDPTRISSLDGIQLDINGNPVEN